MARTTRALSCHWTEAHTHRGIVISSQFDVLLSSRRWSAVKLHRTLRRLSQHLVGDLRCLFRFTFSSLLIPPFQSIMPLQFLVPAMLRVSSSSASSPGPSRGTAHPLHALLKPILLTSRAAGQKYHGRIPQRLLDESEPTDTEEEYIAYAYEKDKVSEAEHGQSDAPDYDEQERIKAVWLEKFERRECVPPCVFAHPRSVLPLPTLPPFCFYSPGRSHVFVLPARPCRHCLPRVGYRSRSSSTSSSYPSQRTPAATTPRPRRPRTSLDPTTPSLRRSPRGRLNLMLAPLDPRSASARTVSENQSG